MIPLAPVSGTWPWYLAGPLIGLFVPALLIAGGTIFGLGMDPDRRLPGALLCTHWERSHRDDCGSLERPVRHLGLWPAEIEATALI